MKHSLLIILTLFVFGSCSRQTPYEGYKKSSKGFYYKLNTIGESDESIEIGDYVTVDIAYATIKDSVFFEGRRKIKLEEPAYKGAIEDCFMLLHKNESASFILLAEPFFVETLELARPSFIQAGDYFKIDLSIIEVQTELDYEKEKQAFLYWIEDFGDYEKVILQQYISEKKIEVKPTESGLVYLPISNGNGSNIEIGDTIEIHYEGIFLNGKYFDSTKRRKQPFVFVYGTEMQVIEGLEEGLSLMHDGEKALFIVPSNLAFGASGSSTGIVPPFTSIIFEVEVLSVKKGKASTIINAQN
jgi:FKBP-type peptidyl-prolyl cis-trans isomerase FkpA